MGNRMKEAEKIEQRIRNLLKLPENRKCINCKSLGPQYVCTTFLTFVCTNCSGVHREFTHRVKSVSMAKFTAEEVASLQAGGNERARQVYFKEWDPLRQSYPDGSNLLRLREFIKHVYVDRKYTGERSMNALPRLRLNRKESSFDGRKLIACHSAPRIPLGDQNYGSLYAEISSPGGRRAGYSPEMVRNGGFRSIAGIEIVDDRIRDDGSEYQKSSKRESGPGSTSTDAGRTVKTSSQMRFSIKGMQGEYVSPQQARGVSREQNQMHAGDSARNQNNSSSRGGNSTAGSPADLEKATSESLIDFGVNSAAPSQTYLNPQFKHNKSSSLELSANEKASQLQRTKTLESLLLELSVPSTAAPSIKDDALSTFSGVNTNGIGVSLAMPAGQTPAVRHSVDGSMVWSTTNVNIADGQQSPSMQQQKPSASFFPDVGSGLQMTTLPPNHQPWSSKEAPPSQESLSFSAYQSSETVSKSPADATAIAESQPFSVEARPSGRRELSADLFTANYALMPAPVSGWQSAPRNPMSYSFQFRQYHNVMPSTAVPNAARSWNPFDLNDEYIQENVLPFPSMASMEGALPSSPSLHMPSFQPQYSGAYAGQQMNRTMSQSRPYGIDGYGIGSTGQNNPFS